MPPDPAAPEAESAQPEAAAPEAQAEPKASEAEIQIHSGRPDAEELAALVAVLSALGGGGDAEPDPGRSVWSDPAWRLTGPQPRRGGWRSSALPR